MHFLASTGLIAEVQPQDREGRLAILQARAAQHAIAIPLDILEYLTDHLDADVRKLEGALEQVLLLAQLQGAPVELPVAVEAVKARTSGNNPHVRRR